MIEHKALVRMKETWEAAATIHPMPDHHCLIVAETDHKDRWSVLAYIEIEGNEVLVNVAAHAMAHLVSEQMPLWIGHVGPAFVLTVPPDERYKGAGLLQKAAEAGDPNVREMLVATGVDADGCRTQHFTLPLNEPEGPVKDGEHFGYVTSILTSMWAALAKHRA